MRGHVHGDVEIAGRPATEAGIPLPRNADAIAMVRAGWNTDQDRLRSGLLPAAAGPVT